MKMEYLEPPMMSGARQENAPIPRPSRRASKTFSNYSSDSKSEGQSVEDRRGQSFFIVSDPQKHGHRPKNLERIEIRTVLKPSSFRKISKPKENQRTSAFISSLYTRRRHANNPEANIPLPESGSESSSENESETSHPRDTLQTMVPHPPPRLHSTSKTTEGPEHSTQAPRKHSSHTFKYPRMVSHASKFFKHFDKVGNGALSRNNTIAKISSIDFFESSRSSLREFELDSNDTRNILKLGEMGQIPKEVKRRLLIVPDLAPQTINLLGNLFKFSPEVFEEHLINSGYNGANYDDKPAHTWPTAKMKKSHASIKWYRPVQRLDVAPYSNRGLDVLLDPKQGRLKRTADSDKDLHVYQAQSNIFRSEWEMWTDPKITTREKRISGWEERATIWSQKLDNRDDCYIVILILDPLPIIEEGIERVVEAARVYRPDEDDSYSDPKDTEYLQRLAEHLQYRDTLQKPTTLLHKMLNLFGLATKHIPFSSDTNQDDEAASMIDQSFETVKVTILDPVTSRPALQPVFKQVVPRAHIGVDLDEAFRSKELLGKLGLQLSNTRSTKEEFCQWLVSLPELGQGDFHLAIATPLYHIIQQDSKNLLSHLHKTLDEINIDILSDSKLEDRVVMWRRIIARAEVELPELQLSIKSFFTFTQLLNTEGVWDEFESLSSDIDVMIQKLQIASSSLTSNMALLDSRRSIAEAQSVTKLTELAFFFIPLSFAATLFGMQVEQLATPAPISTFIALGIGFIASSYIVRLIIRSTWLHLLVKAYKESIAIYAQNKRRPLKQGNVPASMFLRWVGHMATHGVAVGLRKMLTWIGMSHMGKVIIAASLVFLVVVPLSIIWTRPLAPGIKAAVTTVIVLVAVISIVFNAMLRLVSKATHQVDTSIYDSD